MILGQNAALMSQTLYQIRTRSLPRQPLAVASDMAPSVAAPSVADVAVTGESHIFLTRYQKVDMPSQLEIAKRVESMIRRKGIPSHVKKLSAFDLKLAQLPRKEFLSALRKYVHNYHEHSSLTVTPDTSNLPRKKSPSKHRRTQLPTSPAKDSLAFRFPPKLHLSGNILTIRLGVFVTTLGMLRTVRQDWDDQVREVRSAVRAARKNNTGIILDLRKHSGGNFKPVVDMFEDLFQNTSLFAWCNKVPTSKSKDWSNLGPEAKGTWRPDQHSYEGKITEGRFISGEFSYPCNIAVIFGSRTYSSGEFAAAMFCGKPGVRLFGQNSGGGLSVNGGLEVVPGITLGLTTQLVATTDGVMHLAEFLKPDVYTKNPLRDAHTWLKSVTPPL